jgi:hypothetical protein
MEGWCVSILLKILHRVHRAKGEENWRKRLSAEMQSTPSETKPVWDWVDILASWGAASSAPTLLFEMSLRSMAI